MCDEEERGACVRAYVRACTRASGPPDFTLEFTSSRVHEFTSSRVHLDCQRIVNVHRPTIPSVRQVVGEVNIGASSMMVNGRKIVFTALIMAGVYRYSEDGKWHLRTIGKPAMGFNFNDSLDTIRSISDTMLDDGMKYERVLSNAGPTFDMKKVC